jgi:hypothetical protein
MSSQAADQCSPTANETTAAQERADAIRRGIDAIASALAEVPELVQQAYKADDWRTLGYQSWQDYVYEEFRTSLIKLDVATRKTWTHSLREAGLSTREIAPVTNVSQMQVSRDGRETNVSPKTADEKLLAHIGQATKALERIRDEINGTNVHDRNAQDGIQHLTSLVKEIINAGARKEAT